MKLPLLFVIGIGSWQSAWSQGIDSCVSNQTDTTTQAKLLWRLLKLKRDTLWYRNAPVHICSSNAEFTIGFGISEFYNKSVLRLYSDTFSKNSPFNNKKNSVKNGVWFTYTLLGHLKTAAEYDEGRLATRITFWANGLPKSIQRFNLAGRPVTGGDVKYEKSNR